MSQMGHNAELYVHRPLSNPQKCIRLLKLRPALLNASQMLCELVEVRLDDHPKYEALSYTWDAQIATSRIACENGQELAITKNCELALQRSRQRWESRMLWIDSVCINQEEDDEKSSQVALMGQIYSQASTVVVWLGEADEVSNVAMDALISLMQQTMAYKDDGKGEGVWLDEDGRQHTALDLFFQRPWFHRMWTLQEIVMAQDAVLVCGGRQVSWASIQDAFHTHIFAFGKYLVNYIWFELEMQDTLRLRQARNAESARKFSYLEILQSSRKRKCADPKDAIFALYGIALELGIPAPQPDYSKSTRDIYADATRAALIESDNLAVLYSCDGSSSKLDLPSWVPDWSNPGLDFGFMDSCSASKKSVAVYSFDSQLHHLTVTGHVVYKIDARISRPLPLEDREFLDFYDLDLTTSSLTASSHRREALKDETRKKLKAQYNKLLEYLSCFLSWAYTVAALQSSDPPLHTATWFSRLIWKMKYPTDDQLIPDGVVPYYQWCVFMCEIFTTIPTEESIAETFVRICSSRSLLDIHREVVKMMCGRKAFKVEGTNPFKGAGVGPLSMEVGDMIVLLSGVKVPMIVRPKGDNYHLVGWAFVSDQMTGESWLEGQSPLTKFTLV